MAKNTLNNPTTMEELLASLSAKPINLVRGQTISGEVVSLSDREVTLDLGTKSEGVIPSKEFPAGQLPKIGDRLDTYVIEPENEASQVVLSLQQAPKSARGGQRAAGPTAAEFAKLVEKFQSDDTFPGTVTRISEFGVFIKLEDGVEGLIHSSKLGTSSFEVGQKISVMVDSIEPEKRRISLSPVVTSTKDLIYK